MTITLTADGFYGASAVPPRVARLQRALLWAVGFSSAIVMVEPSPYEIATLIATVFFYVTGMRMRPVFLPLILLLVVVNLGYSICAAYLLDDNKVTIWVLTSWYMAITAIFFAIALADDTQARLDALRRGLILGALIASITGFIGYFHLIPGGENLFTLYSRLKGTFKDPNVIGAFLILPALFTLQDVLTQPFGKALRGAIAFAIISLAVLLAFSRAAWGQLVFTSAVMLVTMYMTSPSRRQRSRIVVTTLAAVAVMSLLVMALLSFKSVDSLFKERASLSQSYDTGRFGRFGRHALGFQMALDMPLGIGPLQFGRYFPEGTHNSFLNAFMSGGWLSGVSFPALIFITLAIGFRLIFLKVPWQRAYLAVFAAFLGSAGESFIIDVDHWRHFWMLLGAMWAMNVAAYDYIARHRADRGSPSPSGQPLPVSGSGEGRHPCTKTRE